MSDNDHNPSATQTNDDRLGQTRTSSFHHSSVSNRRNQGTSDIPSSIGLENDSNYSNLTQSSSGFDTPPRSLMLPLGSMLEIQDIPIENDLSHSIASDDDSDDSSSIRDFQSPIQRPSRGGINPFTYDSAPPPLQDVPHPPTGINTPSTRPQKSDKGPITLQDNYTRMGVYMIALICSIVLVLAYFCTPSPSDWLPPSSFTSNPSLFAGFSFNFPITNQVQLNSLWFPSASLAKQSGHLERIIQAVNTYHTRFVELINEHTTLPTCMHHNPSVTKDQDNIPTLDDFDAFIQRYSSRSIDPAAMHPDEQTETGLTFHRITTLMDQLSTREAINSVSRLHLQYPSMALYFSNLYDTKALFTTPRLASYVLQPFMIACLVDQVYNSPQLLHTRRKTPPDITNVDGISHECRIALSMPCVPSLSTQTITEMMTGTYSTYNPIVQHQSIDPGTISSSLYTLPLTAPFRHYGWFHNILQYIREFFDMTSTAPHGASFPSVLYDHIALDSQALVTKVMTQYGMIHSHMNTTTPSSGEPSSSQQPNNALSPSTSISHASLRFFPYETYLALSPPPPLYSPSLQPHGNVQLLHSLDNDHGSLQPPRVVNSILSLASDMQLASQYVMHVFHSMTLATSFLSSKGYSTTPLIRDDTSMIPLYGSHTIPFSTASPSPQGLFQLYRTPLPPQAYRSRLSHQYIDHRPMALFLNAQSLFALQHDILRILNVLNISFPPHLTLQQLYATLLQQCGRPNNHCLVSFVQADHSVLRWLSTIHEEDYLMKVTLELNTASVIENTKRGDIPPSQHLQDLSAAIFSNTIGSSYQLPHYDIHYTFIQPQTRIDPEVLPVASISSSHSGKDSSGSASPSAAALSSSSQQTHQQELHSHSTNTRLSYQDRLEIILDRIGHHIHTNFTSFQSIADSPALFEATSLFAEFTTRGKQSEGSRTQSLVISNNQYRDLLYLVLFVENPEQIEILLHLMASNNYDSSVVMTGLVQHGIEMNIITKTPKKFHVFQAYEEYLSSIVYCYSFGVLLYSKHIAIPSICPIITHHQLIDRFYFNELTTHMCDGHQAKDQQTSGTSRGPAFLQSHKQRAFHHILGSFHQHKIGTVLNKSHMFHFVILLPFLYLDTIGPVSDHTLASIYPHIDYHHVETMLTVTGPAKWFHFESLSNQNIRFLYSSFACMNHLDLSSAERFSQSIFHPSTIACFASSYPHLITSTYQTLVTDPGRVVYSLPNGTQQYIRAFMNQLLCVERQYHQTTPLSTSSSSSTAHGQTDRRRTITDPLQSIALAVSGALLPHPAFPLNKPIIAETFGGLSYEFTTLLSDALQYDVMRNNNADYVTKMKKTLDGVNREAFRMFNGNIEKELFTLLQSSHHIGHQASSLEEIGIHKINKLSLEAAYIIKSISLQQMVVTDYMAPFSRKYRSLYTDTFHLRPQIVVDDLLSPTAAAIQHTVSRTLTILHQSQALFPTSEWNHNHATGSSLLNTILANTQALTRLSMFSLGDFDHSTRVASCGFYHAWSQILCSQRRHTLPLESNDVATISQWCTAYETDQKQSLSCVDRQQINNLPELLNTIFFRSDMNLSTYSSSNPAPTVFPFQRDVVFPLLSMIHDVFKSPFVLLSLGYDYGHALHRYALKQSIQLDHLKSSLESLQQGAKSTWASHPSAKRLVQAIDQLQHTVTTSHTYATEVIDTLSYLTSSLLEYYGDAHHHDDHHNHHHDQPPQPESDIQLERRLFGQSYQHLYLYYLSALSQLRGHVDPKYDVFVSLMNASLQQLYIPKFNQYHVNRQQHNLLSHYTISHAKQLVITPKLYHSILAIRYYHAMGVVVDNHKAVHIYTVGQNNNSIFLCHLYVDMIDLLSKSRKFHDAMNFLPRPERCYMQSITESDVKYGSSSVSLGYIYQFVGYITANQLTDPARNTAVINMEALDALRKAYDIFSTEYGLCHYETLRILAMIGKISPTYFLRNSSIVTSLRCLYGDTNPFVDATRHVVLQMNRFMSSRT